MVRRSSRLLSILIAAAVLIALLLSPFTGTIKFANAGTLQTSLMAYWRFEEASSTRFDDLNGCGGSGCDLTDNNTVTQNTGIIGNAAEFTRANSEWLSHATHADLQSGGTSNSWTIAGWFRLGNTVQLFNLLTKWGGPPNNEYTLYYSGTRFVFCVSSNGSTSTCTTANNFGTPTANVFYFVAGWYDASAQTLNISINDGAIDSVSYANGVYGGGTTDFMLGSAGGSYLLGRIDEVGIWRRALTSSELTLLYNSGAGCQNDFQACEGTFTPTPTITDTPTNTDTPTSTQTITDTPTETSTPTDTATITPTASDTPTATETETETPGPTPTSSDTPTPTDTATATATATITPTRTNTPTPTITRTPPPCATDDYAFTFIAPGGNGCVRVVRQATFGEIYIVAALLMLFALGMLYFTWKVITRWISI